MKKTITVALYLLLASSVFPQETEIMLTKKDTRLYGTLASPPTKDLVPVVLIIAGSGPTDRNCNNSQMQTNAFKMLADSLLSHNIASLRYDKRGVGKSERGDQRESELTIEHFAEDALAWVNKLANDKRFNQIIICGHSEGALIGTLVAQKSKKIKALISVAGAGRPLDIVLKDQLSGMVPEAKEIMYGIIAQLKKGDTVGNIPPLLSGLFRPSVQPFLISLFSYDPAAELAKLKMPILVINGDTDFQVKTEDAEILAKANPRASLKIIKNMNHVLKYCDYPEKSRQIKEAYDAPHLPLNADFVKEVAHFIETLK